jgi:CYTH domain-containing protein
MTIPKYARLIYERRFLVDRASDWRGHLKPYSKLLGDRYLACGRLRLRRLEDPDTGRVAFKLTKKYESANLLAQPCVNSYLAPEEYQALRALPGYDLSKTRHYQESGGAVFSIDEFHGALAGLILCETEDEDAAVVRAAPIPEFARWEVTADPFFTGGILCRQRPAQIEEAIRRLEGRSMR